MEIRQLGRDDLLQLLELYTQLHDNSVPLIDSSLEKLWDDILSDKNHYIVGAFAGSRLISSCVIIIVPNLTHNQCPYALIENVITDRAHRKKGYGTGVLNFAREIAQKTGCYKIMLLTGSKEKNTLNFYEKAGFNCHDKTAFVQWL